MSRAPFALLPLLLPFLAPAQQPAAALAERPAGSRFRPPPPLSAEHFRGRRQALMAAAGEGVILLRGAPDPADMGAFGQLQDFYYLSGIEEPGLAMLLFPETGAEELLVPPFNRFTATWVGAFLAPGEEAARRTGFAVVGNVRGLKRRLDEILAVDPETGRRPVLWTPLQPEPGPTGTPSQAQRTARATAADPFDGRIWREEALRRKLLEWYPDLEVRDLSPLLGELRARKTQGEIAQLRAAAEIGVQGLAEAIRSTEPGIYEYQIAAAARYVFSRLGAGPDAYGAIVGSGKNGCILHYMQNRRQVRDGDLIVMDYGPTFRGYATDITRTFPANGTFTDEQRELVQDVYEIQQALIAEVRPGATLSGLSRLSRKLLAERGYRTDHGPCHHVGLAVHDPSVDVLEPGMVITVEPGAYLRDKGMGCRIEDTVLVTEDGCTNLSGHLPASPDAIEALMRQTGIHQVPVGLPDK